jgi:hypothetical protein
VRLAILLLFGLAHAARGQAIAWSNWSALRDLPDTIALRAPSVVANGDTMFVAGNVFPKDINQFVGRRRLVIARSPGGMLPIPPGSFDFAYPRLARDGRGALHLVWAEFADSSGSLAAWMTPPTSLWHSIFRNGRWSPPHRIFAGRTLTWAGDGRPMTTDSSGNIHIAVPALLSAGQFAVVHLRIDSSGAVVENDFSPGASYASITRLSRDSLLIAYSTSDSLTPTGGSSIFVRVSSDGGRSWATPISITRSERRNASPPVVEATRTGLDAFWVEDSRNPAGPQVFRAYTTRSPKASWVEITPAYVIEGMAVHGLSAGTACGSYSVILEILSGPQNDPTIRLVNLAVYDGRLTATPLFPDLVTAMSAGMGADRERISLIFSAIRPGEQRAIPATASGRACRTM